MTGFDPHTPSSARVYDYWLGGKDNFAADRELAERLVAMAPAVAVVARDNRRFLGRATTWIAGQGISQFIDLGCGLPTKPSTHGSARAVRPGARVAYVDNDPVVLSHLDALAVNDQAMITVPGDITDPDAIGPRVRTLIDFGQPACLILGSVLHFYPHDIAVGLLARYIDPLAPGSYLVISVGVAYEGDGSKVGQEYKAGAAQFHSYSREQVAGLFGLPRLELIDPGVTEAPRWRAGWEPLDSSAPRDTSGDMLVGVARVA